MSDKDMKKRAINPLPILVADDVLIDSINTNTWEWQMDKSIQANAELLSALIDYKQGRNTDEQVLSKVADASIQMGILLKMFASPIVQTFINRRLASIDNKNRLIKEKSKTKGKVGFNPND